MSEHVISMIVNDELGMLARITSIFKRKMLNIKSMTIIHEENEHTPRITSLVEGNEQDADLACKFLSNNADVLSIEMFSSDAIIQRDLVLIKAEVGPMTEQKIAELNKDFKFRILRKTEKELVIEYIGSQMEVSLFIDQVKNFAPIKISRTGIML